jgi:hypothetical protein
MNEYGSKSIEISWGGRGGAASTPNLQTQVSSGDIFTSISEVIINF